MRDGIQSMLAEAGEAACYALCLIDVAEEYLASQGTGGHIDALRAFEDAADKGYIHYNWADRTDNDNFYVFYPALFLEMMTGRKWSVTHEPASRLPKSGFEYVIRRYERVATGSTSAHFERDRFKPIKESVTVSHGKEVSTRVCRVLN